MKKHLILFSLLFCALAYGNTEADLQVLQGKTFCHDAGGVNMRMRITNDSLVLISVINQGLNLYASEFYQAENVLTLRKLQEYGANSLSADSIKMVEAYDGLVLIVGNIGDYGDVSLQECE